MNKLLLSTVAAVALSTTAAMAQLSTAYFMEGSTLRYQLNPALTPQRGYISIPFVGAMGFEMNSNFLTIDNFLYPNPNGDGLVSFMHGSVSSSEFLGRLRNNNKLGVNMNIGLFGIGNYSRHGFWSFGINMVTDVGMNLPKELFSMVKQTKEGEYDLSDTAMEMNSRLETAFGWSMKIGENLSVGGRLKFLMGIAAADLTLGNARANLNGENYTAQAAVNLKANITGMSFDDMADKSYTMDELSTAMEKRTFNASNIANFGGAIDLGAEYSLLDDRLRLSAAVNDLGFIAWNNKSAFNANTDQLTVTYNGIDATMDNVEVDVDMPEDVKINVGKATGRNKRINTSFTTGAEYSFFDRRLGLGLLYKATAYNAFTRNELTASVNGRPCKWFSVSLSQSLVNSRIGVLGLALNIHPSWINLFVGTDFISFRYGEYTVNNESKDEQGQPTGSSTPTTLRLPVNMKSANFYFGLAVPLSKPKR